MYQMINPVMGGQGRLTTVPHSGEGEGLFWGEEAMV
jgi:hypothetical protein